MPCHNPSAATYEFRARRCAAPRNDAETDVTCITDPRSHPMNKPVPPSATVRGEEHWTNKGSDVRLFMWEKYAGEPVGPAGTILFVHGSSMASQPTFDLQ